MIFLFSLRNRKPVRQGLLRQRPYARGSLAGLVALVAITIGPAMLPSFSAHAISPNSKAALWEGLRTGKYVALIRHAIAPGSGDPAHFKIGECKTQRNLSEEGRQQARNIGKQMQAFGIAEAAVYSSQWCRCRETARLLGIGRPKDLPPLNSFFQKMARGSAQTKVLRRWIRARKPGLPLVLVTHYVNIQALTGYAPASGEVVLVRLDRRGRVTVAGTVRIR